VPHPQKISLLTFTNTEVILCTVQLSAAVSPKVLFCLFSWYNSFLCMFMYTECSF